MELSTAVAGIPERKTEVVVIGSGPAGYVAAIRLGQLGKKVLLVEEERAGGTCLNWGCIPSKALIHLASLYEKTKKAEIMGLQASTVTINPATFQQWKNGMIERLTQGIAALCKNAGVEIIAGQASFLSPHALEIRRNDGAEQVEADYFIVATGTSPVLPPGFSLQNPKIMTSKEILDVTEIPKTLLVIGGGLIGLELGIAFQKLGSRLVIVEKLGQLLSGTDPELVRVVERSIKKRGAEIHANSKVLECRESGNLLEAVLETPEGEKKIPADAVLLAAGFTPKTERLRLDAAGVKTDARGFIPVDNQLKTNLPHIFAVGDVHGSPFLAHKAFKEGETAAEVISGLPRKLDYKAMPSAIFTDPEIAVVGLSEEEAKKSGREISVGRYPLGASGRALSMGEAEGVMKIIADSKTGKILGVQLACAEASELIGEATLAIEMEATVEQLASTIHPHPTLSEGLMEGAKQILGKAIHIPNPPRAGALARK